ncbi:MAG TPA: alpha/beta fold hydrolase [Acidimicrobiales bacterium]|jgi:pimeloyl-ACP methyl ester carboxylesterase
MSAGLVLVHGGTVTSTMWDPVLPYLDRPVLAVDLPGRRYQPADLGKITRADWVAAVIDQIVRGDLGPVVLVGHSSAGFVIPEVAAALPDRVAHLVFVAATVPADGMRPVDYIKPRLRQLALDHVDLVREMAAGKTLGGLRPGEPPISTELEIVENDPRMGLEAPGPLHETYQGWSQVPRRLPRTFVRCRQDRVVTAELVDQMLPHLGEVDVVEIDAGHDVATEAPRELARLLDEIAAASD